MNDLAEAELFPRLCAGNLQLDFHPLCKIGFKLCIKHFPHSREFIFNVHVK